MKNIIKQFIPKPIKFLIKKIYYFSADTIDLLLGRRDDLTPPKRMILSVMVILKKLGKSSFVIL